MLITLHCNKCVKIRLVTLQFVLELSVYYFVKEFVYGITAEHTEGTKQQVYTREFML